MKILRKICWSVINAVHSIRLRFDMWLNDYEYGSLAAGYLRFYGKV